ncbi:MAG: GGDEF domain-containing protein [Planctomycetota bacterium]|nr:MAG: GGDEF domain-containing protein [Planctomycetota bacterium]
MRTSDFDTNSRFLQKLRVADTLGKLNKLLAAELAKSLSVKSTALLVRYAPVSTKSRTAKGINERIVFSFEDLSSSLRNKRTPFRLEPPHEDYDSLASMLGRRAKAAYVLPLIDGSSRIGVFIVGTNKAKGFSANEMKSLAAFARFAAIALCMSPLGGVSGGDVPWDAETGMFNRAFFDAMLSEEIKRADRGNYEFCLMQLHLGGYEAARRQVGPVQFRNILGHVANAIRAKLRDLDIIGRIDEDAFSIILPDVGAATGRKIGSRILRDIVKVSVPGKARAKKTASRKILLFPAVGIAVYPNHASFKGVLIEAAEMALEKASTKKKPAVVVFS